ncbi:hypothetical protein AVEN_190725-1, partial [Araneus ventricosus]
GGIILDALTALFATSTISTLIILVAHFGLVKKGYKYLMAIDSSYFTLGIAFLAGVLFALIFLRREPNIEPTVQRWVIMPTFNNEDHQDSDVENDSEEDF